MARKIHTPERIIGMLREFEVRLAQGEKAGAICRSLSISEQSYYRWRREYGGLKLNQAKRFKDLERENERLKKAVSELTLDKLILKEAAEGNTKPFPPSAMCGSRSRQARHLRAPGLPRRWPGAFHTAPEAQDPQ